MSSDEILTTSTVGLDLIKSFEGFRSKPYLDQNNVATVGYGTTFYPDGSKVSLRDQAIDEDYAIELLQHALEEFEKVINENVEIVLSQNEFDALASFVYNVGPNAFKKSTLLKILNQGLYDQVPVQLMRWNKVAGKINRGLTRRRQAEAELFMREE